MIERTTVVVGAAELQRYAAELLARVGFAHPDAGEVAAALVEADLRGIPSHGVLHLPNLIYRTRLGLVRTVCELRIVAEAPAVARIDGGHAPGVLVASRAMDVAVRKAEATGVAAVAVLNSTHFGMGARHAERAAAAGMIGLALSNATPMLPAPGGTERVIGTNPIAIAVPDEAGRPALSLDMGLGQVTLGFVRDCLQRGVALPAGVAVGPDGLDTTDPARVLSGGLILPIGGHKGFGLAVAVEVLAGALAGAAVGPEVGSLFVDYDRPQGTGHFLLALDPRRFLPGGQFVERLERLVRWIKRSARAPGAGPIYLPGERAQAEARARRTGGVPLSRETAAALSDLGREWGIAAPASLTAVA